jgi:hypothetical protein
MGGGGNDDGGSGGMDSAGGAGGSGGTSVTPPPPPPARQCATPAVADPVVDSVGTPAEAGLEAYDAERASSATYYNDFAASDIATWTTYNGTWAADSGVLALTAGEAKALYTDGEAAALNWPSFCSMVVEADIRITAGDTAENAGFVFSVSSASNGADAYVGYYVGLRPGGDLIEFGRASYGWLEIDTAPFVSEVGEWYRLKVIVADEGATMHVTVLVDGEEVLTADVMNVLLPGTVGIRSFNAAVEWDNFSVHQTSEEIE